MSSSGLLFNDSEDEFYKGDFSLLTSTLQVKTRRASGNSVPKSTILDEQILSSHTNPLPGTSNHTENSLILETESRTRGAPDDKGRSNGFMEPELALAWRGLTVHAQCVEQKYFGFKKTLTRKKIIDNVSGVVLPGSLIALIGPSGAGKSTLLRVISHRVFDGLIINGEIHLNGRPVDDAMKFLSGFMFQEDFFISCLTVYEHLKYTARLRMDRRSTRRQINRRIQALIEMLGLGHVAHRKIGGLESEGEKSVLSKGEKKRLSFATACITLPRLLFLDEPTTGLDSYTAARLVGLMKAMVEQVGCSIIATLHQPSPEILTVFSSVMILADGRLVFAGRSEEAVDFFQKRGYQLDDKSNGDFLLNCVASGSVTFPVQKLSREFAASEYFDKMENSISEFEDDRTSLIQHPLFEYKPPLWPVQLFWIYTRGIIESFRNPEVQWIRMFQKMLIAITAGFCYLDSIKVDQKGIQDVQGVLFLLVAENTFSPMYAVMALFPKEYAVFIREYSNGAYQPSVYYVSKVFQMLPGLILEAVLFTACLYWMAGIQGSLYSFALILFFTALCIIVATACGTLFSCSFDHVANAMVYLIPLEYLSMVTSGLFLKLSTIPVFLVWLKYISWFMYTYESMSIVHWAEVTSIECPVSQNASVGCLTNGQQVLEHYSFTEDHLIRNMIGLFALFLGFHAIGFVNFSRKLRRQE